MAATPRPVLAQRLLSKAELLSGDRCVRKLWLDLREPQAPGMEDSELPRTVRWSQRIREKDRESFPDGILIEGAPAERVERTREALAAGARTLFGASFEHRGICASSDMLRKTRGGWTLTKVGASTSVKPKYLLDVAVQAWVLRGAGIDIRRVEVAILNSKCTFPDLSDLLIRKNVTAEVQKLLRKIPKLVQEVRRGVDTRSLPVVQLGPQCSDPRSCPFMGRCWRDLPEHHVSELYKISAKKLAALQEEGVETIHDVPDDFALTGIQDRQRRAVQSGKAVIEDGLEHAVSGLKAPVGFLDFETVALPIPRWEGCHPYEQIPVQFSFDLQTQRGIRHSEWIADGPGDPRPEIVAALVEACEGAKTILAYSASFERGCIDRLASAVPRLAKKLRHVRDRIEDLLPMVRNHVYHPDFHGSFSIKDVHPALTGLDPYGRLVVPSGEAAMDALEKLMFDSSLSARERKELRRNLLVYCGTDTRVMVEVHGWLASISGLSGP